MATLDGGGGVMRSAGKSLPSTALTQGHDMNEKFSQVLAA